MLSSSEVMRGQSRDQSTEKPPPRRVGPGRKVTWLLWAVTALAVLWVILWYVAFYLGEVGH